MKLAIAILNFNGEELLRKFLPTIVKHSLGHDIYVIDNNSSDDSVQIVKSEFPEVKLIELNNNYGYTGGYNKGLKKIDAEVLALVNSDIEVTENWIEPILKCFKKHENLGLAQPKIKDYKSKSHFEYAGAAGGLIDSFGYPFCRGRIFDTVEEDYGQYDQSIAVDWASGACLFVRADLFHELGGFDTGFFAHFEEIDLAWRARNRGYKIASIPKSTVFHVGGATLSTNNPQKTYLNFRNSLLTLLKNLPSKRLLPIIFSRMVLDGLAGLQFLAKGKFQHFIAVLKAHMSFYRKAYTYYKKRKQILNKGANYYNTRSVVWDYFIRKKNKFSEL